MQLETIRIRDGEGYLTINKSDFQPDKHIPYLDTAQNEIQPKRKNPHAKGSFAVNESGQTEPKSE